MKYKKNYNQHKQHKQKYYKSPENFEEYQLLNIDYDEMCEYADFLCEFFKIVEETAPINDDDDLDYLDIIEEDGPQKE